MMKKVPAHCSKIVALYCQHTIRENADIDAVAQKAKRPTVKPVMMPCSSRVQVSHLLKMLDEGASGVELIACPEDQCRVLVGSRKAEKRIQHAQQMLGEAGIEPERLGITRAHGLTAEQVVELALKRAEAIGNVKSKGAKDRGT